MWRKGQAFLLGESHNDHPTRQSSNRGRAGCSSRSGQGGSRSCGSKRAADNLRNPEVRLQETASALDWDNRDPFDRVLVAHCLNRDLALVTADARLRARNDIAVVWAG
jgi:hypothetical protein